MRKIIIAILAAFLAASAFADPRIRVEEYRSDKVYQVYTMIGKATLIQLEPGEYIDPAKTDLSVLGIGFGDAWTLGVRQNNIILKPARTYPDTNMLIVTNKRTYILELLNQKNRPPTYSLSFTYPESERRETAERLANANRLVAQAISEKEERDRITAGARAQKVTINTDYYWRGKNALLAPTAAWDDGRFIHLQYNHAGELPVFYKVMPDGSEAQINTNISPVDGSETVLQEVVKIVRVRLNDDVIEIVNHNFKRAEFNRTGTSEHGTVRVDKANGVPL